MRYIGYVQYAMLEQHQFFIEATAICNKMLSDRGGIRAFYLPVFRLLPNNEHMTPNQLYHLFHNVGDVSLTVEAGKLVDLQMQTVYSESGLVNRVGVGRQFSINACMVALNIIDNAILVILVGLLRKAAHALRPLVNMFLHLPAGQVTPVHVGQPELESSGYAAERMLFNSLGDVLQEFNNLHLVRLINVNLPAQLSNQHRKVLPTANVTAIMSGLRSWAREATLWNWCLPRTAPQVYFQQWTNFRQRQR